MEQLAQDMHGVQLHGHHDLPVVMPKKKATMEHLDEHAQPHLHLIHTDEKSPKKKMSQIDLNR